MHDDSQAQTSRLRRFIDPEIATLRAGLRLVKNRVIGGIVLALPIVVTFFILYKLFTTFQDFLILPVAGWVMTLAEQRASLPPWFGQFGAPAIAVVVILAILYLLGMFLHSKLHRALDWSLLHLPVVTTIYKAVRDVVHSLDKQRDPGAGYKRVVLVEFPHAGMRVPAFVTSSCIDVETGKRILCVYVPTTPMPTSGYMLLVPEENVTPLDWDMEETLQAVVSGGISVPERVRYFAAGAGPSTWSRPGEPIESGAPGSGSAPPGGPRIADG